MSNAMKSHDELRHLMDMDIPVRVYRDGGISAQHYGGLWAPEFHLSTDDDGQLIPGWDAELRRQATAQGWSLMGGYTGQHGQGGSPLMGESEFIGGRMAGDILATPGVYVAVVVLCDSDWRDSGWVVAYRHEDEHGEIPGQTDPGRFRA